MVRADMVARQAEARSEEVVKVGLKLFYELGDRAKKLESEVDMYRVTLVALAKQHNVEVPVSLVEDSRGLGEEEQGRRLDQIRDWLGKVLAGPLAVEEAAPRSRRGGRGGGTSAGGRSRSTRGRGQATNET
jgi:hypothetical protein